MIEQAVFTMTVYGMVRHGLDREAAYEVARATVDELLLSNPDPTALQVMDAYDRGVR